MIFDLLPKTAPCRIIPIVSLVGVLLLTNADAAPKVNFTHVTYDIYGSSENDLRMQMDRFGPKEDNGARFDAMTHWDIEWEYRYKRRDQRCYIGEIEVTVNVTRQMPRWIDEPAGPLELRKKWQRYIQKLKKHEARHYQNAKSAGLMIERDIRLMGPEDDCRILGGKANAVGYAVVEKFNIKDIAFDERTGHGSKDGATFP